MLNIRPFHYGLVCKTVYDNGSVFNPSILDIKDEDMIQKFCQVRFSIPESYFVCYIKCCVCRFFKKTCPTIDFGLLLRVKSHLLYSSMPLFRNILDFWNSKFNIR